MLLLLFIRLMVTDETVAWAFMSEGSAWLNITKGKRLCGYIIRPVITIFCNSELSLIKPIEDWCSINKIIFQRTTAKLNKKNQKWKDSYRILIQNYEGIKKSTSLLYPYLIGKKKDVSVIMIKYLEVFPPVKNPLGAMNRWKNNPLIVEKMKRIKHEAKLIFLRKMVYHDEIQKANERTCGNAKYNLEYFENLWNLKVDK